MPETSSHSLRNEILQKALTLDAEDRAFVAEALDQSLAAAGFLSPEIEADRTAEIERRAHLVESGEMPTEDWQDVLVRLRERSSRTSGRCNDT